jgi:hypothetical protein
MNQQAKALNYDDTQRKKTNAKYFYLESQELGL